MNRHFVCGICLFAGIFLGGITVFLISCQSTMSKESALGGPYNTARQIYFASVNFQRENENESESLNMASLVGLGFLDKKNAAEIRDKWRVTFFDTNQIAGNRNEGNEPPLIRMVRENNQKGAWQEEVFVTNVGIISVCYTFIPK